MIKLNDIDNTNINQEPIYEKDRRIEYFIKLLEKKGFIVQEGKIQYIDILKLVSEGNAAQL